MSGSGRKHSSKWDLRDEPEFAHDSKQVRSGRSSADVADTNGSKWSYFERNDKLKPRMGFSSKEPFSGGRGSNKDDIMNKDSGVLDATIAWDTNGSYSMKMSPGFEEWKNKRHSQSPKNGCSRSVRNSRSRSPAYGFRWDSGVNDRNRMRAGRLTQPCRDFAAGKCRRGNHCHFLHHDNQNHEDSWESRHRLDGAPRYSAPHESGDYSLRSGRSNEACINFAKGRCTKGASCKYVHHDNSDGVGKVSVDESTRERGRTENSSEHGGGHGPSHSGDTPCKFFAFGNCRNAKHCRFSHDRQACKSPDRRLWDDRSRSNQGGDQALDRPKLSDSVSPNGRLRDDRWGSDGNIADVDKVWDGPRQNDLFSVSDTAKLVDDNKNGIMGAPQPGFTAWPMSRGWDRGVDKNRVRGESPLSSDKKGANYWTAEKAGANIRISQSIGADIWPGDEKMSPDWNYGVGSSSHIEEDHGQNKQQVGPGNHMLDVPVTKHPLSIEKPFTPLVQSQMFKKDGVIALTCDDKSDINKSADSRINPNFSTVLPGQGFNQNAETVNASHSSSCHAVRQSQGAVSIVPPRVGIVEGMQNRELSTEKKYTVEPNIMDSRLSQVGSRNPPTQNMVSKEQLAQLTCLSASLAHILGTGQQLPQLYATLNSHDAKDTPFLGKTEGSGMSVSTTFIKPDPTVGFQKRYDPVCDSIEPMNAVASGVPPGFSPIKKIAEDAVEIPSRLSYSGRQNFDDYCKTAFSEEHQNLIQLQQGENIDVNRENNEVVAEERQSSRCDNKITKDNDPLENTDQNSVPGEAKKIKDVKGIRAFKFSLVEYVKELLKPTWKEGQITKEDYKTIVKKVTDKVTGTVQRVHIPQTQEKIDHYLSLSKPKLNKLVQAYVEKAQKA